MSDTVIHLDNIQRYYYMGDFTIKALDGVSLSLERGEYTAVMGPSGSGKSTMMHLLGCLDTPTGGRIHIDGEDISSLTEVELAYLRNAKIGFVFQQFNLLAKMNALDNVMTPLMYAGVPARDRREIAAETLKRVGLGDRMKHKPNELSGGQKQRIAIARALVNDPSIILADEPTGALDTATGDQIMDLFEEINGEGRTVIMVTHDPEVSERCRRIVHLRDGKIESAGDVGTGEAGFPAESGGSSNPAEPGKSQERLRPARGGE